MKLTGNFFVQMKYKVTALAVFCGAVVINLPVSATEFRSGENVEVSGEFSDNLFVSGGQVIARVQSTDDIYIAGGKIDFSGKSAESLWTAGGDLFFRQLQARYGIFAGGNISLENAKLRELIIAGGSLRIHGAEIQDDLLAAGGKISLDRETTVKGSAMIAGGKVTLAGHFAGDVQVYAERLRIASSAVIEGNLSYTTKKVDISPEARIVGSTVAHPMKRDRWEAEGAAVFSGLLFFLGLILVIPLIAALFSRLVYRGRDQIRGRFWETLGKGTVVALIVPAVWVILLISVIGTPIALALIPFIVAGKLLACSIAAFTVGDGLRKTFNKGAENDVWSRRRLFGWTALASLAIFLVLWIPLLGFILALLAFLAGLGALYKEAKIYFCERTE